MHSNCVLTLDCLFHRGRHQGILVSLARHSCVGLGVARDAVLPDLSLLPFLQVLSQHAPPLSLVRLLQAHHHAAAKQVKVTFGAQWAPLVGPMTNRFHAHGTTNTSERNALCVLDSANIMIQKTGQVALFLLTQHDKQCEGNNSILRVIYAHRCYVGNLAQSIQWSAGVLFSYARKSCHNMPA